MISSRSSVADPARPPGDQFGDWGGCEEDQEEPPPLPLLPVRRSSSSTSTMMASSSRLWLASFLWRSAQQLGQGGKTGGGALALTLSARQRRARVLTRFLLAETRSSHVHSHGSKKKKKKNQENEPLLDLFADLSFFSPAPTKKKKK